MPGSAQVRLDNAGGSLGSNASASQRHLLDPEYYASEAKLRRDAFVRKLPVHVQERVAELEVLDGEISNLEAQFRLERRQLERKYEAMYAPLFAKRASMISEDAAVPQRRADQEVSIPDFWLSAMKAETAVAANVTQKDELALKSLRDITCSTLEEEKGIGFCLQFHFAPNKFFSNTVLTKTYLLSGSDTEPVFEQAEGCEIRWTTGMNLTIAGPNAEPCGSFFRFFDTMKMPSDPATINRFADWIETDFEIARAFKDKLVPHAVRWFTGEAEDRDEYASDDSNDDARDAAEEIAAAREELQAALSSLQVSQTSLTAVQKLKAAATGFRPGPRQAK